MRAGGGQRGGVVGLGDEVGRGGLGPDRGRPGAPCGVVRHVQQQALNRLDLQADERDVVQVLPQVHIGIAGQDLAAEGVSLGLAAPGIVFHAKQYAQALYASGSREWQGKGGRITPAAA